MGRLWLITALAAALSMATPQITHAQTIDQKIVAQLQELGYDDIKIRRTLLGRLRITAQNGEFYREIVVNPVTGVILRDYWRPMTAEQIEVIGNRDPGSGSLVEQGDDGQVDDGGDGDDNSDDDRDDGSDSDDDFDT